MLFMLNGHLRPSGLLGAFFFALFPPAGDDYAETLAT